MTDKELLDAVHEIESRFVWVLKRKVQIRNKNDVAESITFRADYKDAMRKIKDHLTYDKWMEQYFSDGVDLDKMLVFATVSRDLQVNVDKIHNFLVSYIKWYDFVLTYLDHFDVKFLSTIWRSAHFISV